MSTSYNRDAFADLMSQLAMMSQDPNNPVTFTGGGRGKSNVGMQGISPSGGTLPSKTPAQEAAEAAQDPNAADPNFRFYDPSTYNPSAGSPLDYYIQNPFGQSFGDTYSFIGPQVGDFTVPTGGTGVGPAPGPDLNFDALGGNDVEQITVTGTRGTDPISAIGAGGFNITPPDLNLGGDGGDGRQPDADPSTYEEIVATVKGGLLDGANTVIPGLPLFKAGYDLIKDLPEGDFTPEELDTLNQASDAANVFVDSQPTFPEGGTGTTAGPGGISVPTLGGIGSLGRGGRGFVTRDDVLVPSTGQMGDIYSIRQGDTRGRFAAPAYVDPYAVSPQEATLVPTPQDQYYRSPTQAPSGGREYPDWVVPPPPGAMTTQAISSVMNPYTGESVMVPNGGYTVDDALAKAAAPVAAASATPTLTPTGQPVTDSIPTTNMGPQQRTAEEILTAMGPSTLLQDFTQNDANAIANLLETGQTNIGQVANTFDNVEGYDVVEGLLRGGYETPAEVTARLAPMNEGLTEVDLIADLLNQDRANPAEVASYYSSTDPDQFSGLTAQGVTDYLTDYNQQKSTDYLTGLSDVEVGKLIDSNELTAGQAASFYQDRYPGLSEQNVMDSLGQMRTQGLLGNNNVAVMAEGGVVEKSDGIESLLDNRQQAVNRMLSKRAVAQFRDGGAAVKKPLAPANFAGGGIATKLIQKGAEMLGFDDARQIDITREAVDLTNQMVDAGLVDPQFRVKLRMPTSGEESTRQNTGIEGDEEVFNAVNHALFSYHAGKSPLARAGSQAKEIYQGIRLAGAGKDPGSESLDYFNNMFGFDLARQGLSPEEAKSAIIDNIANIDNKGALSRLQAGEPLIAGKDLSRTAEDLRGGGPDVSAFDVLAGVQGLKDGGPPEKVPASFLEGRGNFYGTSNERPRVDTGEQNLTIQKRLDQATPLEQYAFEVLGLEPGLDRAMLLPEADRRSGSQELAVPGLAYDTLKAMLAPAAALKGRKITPEETIELAMETMGSGAAMPGVDIGGDFMAGMAAKPKGGVFAPMVPKENPLGPDFENTGLASYFRNSGAETIPAFYADQLISSGMDEGLAMDIAKRAENYFKKSYGTGSDPIRIQMLEGKIDPIFTENITPELLKQARDDYAASKKGASRTTPALEKFESAYDRATGIIAEANGKFRNEESFDYRTGLIKREQERMTQEGVPRELQNQTYIMPLDPEEYAEAALDNPAIARALAESEPIYEIDPYRVSKDGLRFILPEEIVDGIMSLPANKLENMSFPDIVANVQKTGVAKDVREVRDFSKNFKEETRAIEEASLETIPPENIFNRTLPDSKFLLEKGVKKVDDFGNEGWFRITEPAYTELEGALMDHSVGAYSQSGNYNLGGRKALASGRAGIFSLRNNETGRPRLTVEIDFADPDRPKPTANQIQGPSNSDIKAKDYDKLFSLYDEVGVLIEDAPRFLRDGYRRYKEMGVSGMDDDYFV